MEKYKSDLAQCYIEILNRFPDSSAYKRYYFIYKKKGISRIKYLLQKSPERSLPERDHIFDTFVKKHFQQVTTTKKSFQERYTTENCAVICDGRTHVNLVFVIHEISHFLDLSKWCLEIYCTQNNIDFLTEKLNGICNVNYNIVSQLENFIDYNNLLLDINFWKQLNYKNALIFQMDSILCKKGIEKFIGYNFIGAPSLNFDIMNGGLSIRNISSMIHCIENFEPNKYEEEDKFFCRCLSTNFPTFEVANEFSIEHINHESPYGIHKSWRFLDIDNVLSNITL